jgi:CIC family chloride channel protein
VAESIFRGSLYAHLLEARGIHLDEDGATNDFLSQLTAADVMQHPVETLDADLSLETVVQLLSRSHHRGFPVLEDGKLKGILTQSDIAQASQQTGKRQVKDIMTPNPITINPEAHLSDVLYLLNRYRISRLPVTEGSKLLGIITRSDIIRIEADRLSAKDETQAKPSPSYTVYQTRSPTLNRDRILLPIANPYTASSLIKIAGAIARHHGNELECLQVIEVPRHQLPNEAVVPTQDSRKLLQRAERLGRQWHLPVHTQIRVAHDRAEAILDTIRDRQISLVVMGWKGNLGTQGAIFGSVVDTLIRKAPCALLLVRVGTPRQTFPTDLDHPATWLMPTAGGPNTEAVIDLLPALTELYAYPPHLLFCKVFATPTLIEQDPTANDAPPS